MFTAFKKHIHQNHPELEQNKFLLACSGGLDSVVLAHLCQRNEMDFALAHCNFKLRGKASDGDEHFVRELSKELDKPFYSTDFDTFAYMENQERSLQLAARELRYAWFKQLMAQNNINTLVTAHHADDNLETFLINLSRGTGIKGLVGIPSTKELARPLLPFSRIELSAYAETENIAWREDQSNEETKYLRNKIRHEIVPLLKQLHPTFLDNISVTQDYLKQTAALSQHHLDQIKGELFVSEGTLLKVAIAPLKALKPLDAYLYGLFADYGFSEWQDVKKLLTAMSGKEVHSKTHRLVKDRDHLLLTRIAAIKAKEYRINPSDTTLLEPIKLSISNVDALGEKNANVLYVDKETLKYPIVLRKWEKGDYFYPLGMKGRKKLSKYFKDEKIDVIAKGTQWLLCSGNAIVWVVGRRADERFKITPATKSIVKIVLNS